MQQKKFVILTSERTGSSMLCKALDLHDDVKCFGELFNWFHSLPGWFETEFDKGLDRKFANPKERELGFEYFLDKLRTINVVKHFGFKLMLTHHKEVISHLLDKVNGWQIVILYRNNLLAVYGTRLVSRQTQQSHVFAGQEKQAKRVRVKFIPEEFEVFKSAEIKRQHAVMEQLQQSGRSFFCIEYLDLCHKEGLTKLGNYLNIENSTKLQSPLVKRHSWNVLERFENQDDVLLYLKKNDLMHWAEEKPNHNSF